MQTFSVKVCKYVNNILFYPQNFKERIEEMAAANISLCLAACLLAFRGLSPALHLSHLAQRRFPHTATNHSLYVVRRKCYLSFIK